jgi:hypothetical protein
MSHQESDSGGKRAADGLSPIWALLLRQDAKFTKIDLTNLQQRNRRETAPVVGSEGPIVSLTTHGSRIKSVHLALESISRGSMLPSRIVLWLDDDETFIRRPLSLRRLEDRGLEVRLAPRYGPHTKYYPYLESHDAFEKPLVIADDDVCYPRAWLKGLALSYKEDPAVVSCYRAHVVGLDNGRVAPYLNWKPCRSSNASARHFATGVSGCIYPPAFLREIKAAGTGFLDLCPRADDIWLHVRALRAGFEVRQIGTRSLVFPFIPGTQAAGLSASNVWRRQNDVQIEKTYNSDDIEKLRSCSQE